ncbi:DUF1850 domain-containing protein [Gallibacterium melopsittaci]|uniref:DUF1850 domain-containing protein n=1 Tax=Gallibacterium melopsittaci TaxID=516063 RepID=A0ABV6HYW2_9PAST
MRKSYKIITFLVVVGVMIFSFPIDTIFIHYGKSSCRLPTNEFTLQWKHSVEKQLWQEHYFQQDNVLILDKVFQQTFGAGSPADGKAITAPYGFVGVAKHITLPELNWVVSSNMQGVLFTNDFVLPVYQLVPDYSEIKIIPIKQNLFSFLLGVKCHVKPRTH